MFGRRPSPDIRINHQVTGCWVGGTDNGHRAVYVQMKIKFQNVSGVIARGAFLSWDAKELGAKFSDLECYETDKYVWHANQSSQRSGSLLAIESHRLAPFSQYEVATLQIGIYGDLHEGIDIDLFFGCEGAAPQHFRHHVSQEYLNVQVEQLCRFPYSEVLTIDKEKIGLGMLGLQP